MFCRRKISTFVTICAACVCVQLMISYKPTSPHLSAYRSPIEAKLSVQLSAQKSPPKSSKLSAQQSPLKNASTESDNNSEFTEAIKLLADKDKLIYLALVDSAYTSMALNLYTTSFKYLGIGNYLFVCSDATAHRALQSRGINSIDYFHHTHETTASDYGTAEFKMKTHLKTKMILDAILVGFSVIIIDVDIVLLKNPLPYFDNTSDIQIQDNSADLNSGFYLTRPTKAGINLHKTAWNMATQIGNTTSNQNILSPMMIRWSTRRKLKLKKLPSMLFPCGKTYFEDQHRMFYSDNPPLKEVLVHNNWIVSKAAKIYRFKEHLLWTVDKDGYYSDPTRKYLTYNNIIHIDDTDLFLYHETEALKTALLIAHLLNRTVILPTFSCQRCKNSACRVQSHQCSFNTHFKISRFDSVYENAYREHAFLSHPLVPDSVKVDSPVYHIGTSSSKAPSHVKLFQPLDAQGPTEAEIHVWFGHSTEPVLRFHSLNGIHGNFRNKSYINHRAFDTFVNYRQQTLKFR